MFKLYGSTTSPYVRRLRLWLANVEHEFINMHIFEGKDRKTLLAKNPTLKIPMLEDEARIIFDSRVIFRYLTEKLNYPALSWKQENLLTVIDAANDSLVQLLVLQRSGFDVKSEKMYFKLQYERVRETLKYLDQQAANGEFATWHYPAICLYALVDWISFRELADLKEYAALLAFVEERCERPEVIGTAPRD